MTLKEFIEKEAEVRYPEPYSVGVRSIYKDGIERMAEHMEKIIEWIRHFDYIVYDDGTMKWNLCDRGYDTTTTQLIEKYFETIK